jgi:hypothetical protein
MQNLDPLSEYSDEDLNKSLDECALREVMAERKGLLTEVQYFSKLDKRKRIEFKCRIAPTHQHCSSNSETIKDCTH